MKDKTIISSMTKNIEKLKLGNRTLKTALAVTISIYICHALNLEPALFAAVSAVVNLQPTVYQSYINALQQLGITLIAVFTGLLLALTLGNSPLAVGLSTILVIIIALRLKWNSVILIGIVTAIFIVDTQSSFVLDNSMARVSVIVVGLIVALIINIILAPADYRIVTVDRLNNFNYNTSKLFNQKIKDFIQMRSTSGEDKNKLAELLEESDLLAEAITIYKNEIRVLPWSSQASDNLVRSDLMLELYRYNVQLLHKIQLLYDFEKDRLLRLAEREVKTYSKTLQPIITEIKEANEIILHNNKLLSISNINKKKLENWKSIVIDEQALHKKLENWHTEHMGQVYFISALMEISIILYEIKWTANEQRNIFNQIP